MATTVTAIPVRMKEREDQDNDQLLHANVRRFQSRKTARSVPQRERFQITRGCVTRVFLRRTGLLGVRFPFFKSVRPLLAWLQELIGKKTNSRVDKNSFSFLSISFFVRLLLVLPLQNCC